MSVFISSLCAIILPAAAVHSSGCVKRTIEKSRNVEGRLFRLLGCTVYCSRIITSFKVYTDFCKTGCFRRHHSIEKYVLYTGNTATLPKKLFNYCNVSTLDVVFMLLFHGCGFHFIWFVTCLPCWCSETVSPKKNSLITTQNPILYSHSLPVEQRIRMTQTCVLARIS